MSTQASAKRKLDTSEIVSQYQKRKARTKVETKDSTNPFSVIMENNQLKDSKKAEEIKKLLVGDKALENLEMLNQYKKELQEQIKEDNVAIISSTDSEVFGELKDTIESMHMGVIDITEQLKPFTDVVKALAVMKNNGVTTGVIQEILKEKKEALSRAEKIKELNNEINFHKNFIKAKSDDRILFLGPIKNSSKISIKSAQEKIDKLSSKIQELSDFEEPETKFDLFIEEKEHLSQFLNINSEEHQGKQKQLVNTALSFVSNSDEKMKSVLGKFELMSSQIKKLSDDNYKYNQTYAVLNSASKNAMQENIDKLKDFNEDLETDDAVELLENKRNKRKLSLVVEGLNESYTDTSKVSAELAQSEMKIDTIRKTNKQQFQKAQIIQSSGIASVAAGLSTSLNAVNRAAIGETSESAKMAIDEVNKISLGILKDEMISGAQENKTVADSVREAMESLIDVGNTFEVSSKITREALEDIKVETQDLENAVKDIRSLVEDNSMNSAEVLDNN
jgi:translation initiation factor 1 (eIF-1/SUI1)/uncharacterized protein involved in tolerance to divalent cations